MRIRVTWIPLSLALTLAGCDGPPFHAEGPPGLLAGRPPMGGMTCGNADAVNPDAEPNYSADYLHRWTTQDGCDVRLDYMMTRSGACRDGVDEILTGWPVGTTNAGPNDYRIFLRDRSGVTGAKRASLPEKAVSTGLNWDGNTLWLVPKEDSFVWLVNDGQVERWHQESSFIGCA